nr:sugar transferase [Sulfurimonas sp.]
SNYSLKELSLKINDYLVSSKEIYIIPYIKDLNFSSSDVVVYDKLNLSSIKINNNLLLYKNIVAKVSSEYVFVLLLFPIFVILHIIIASAIKLSSKETVIYKDRRFGKDGKLFDCFKYRTMYSGNKTILKEYLSKNPKQFEEFDKYHKLKNDPRVTKVGKFLRATSLDELAQFINILRGEMSLIGPRPYCVHEKNKFSDSMEVILSVKPGITGYWQVNGRNSLTFKQRITIDKWYIRNWSLWIDFVIFLKTISILLYKRNT